jgi:hypothetical protein
VLQYLETDKLASTTSGNMKAAVIAAGLDRSMLMHFPDKEMLHEFLYMSLALRTQKYLITSSAPIAWK